MTDTAHELRTSLTVLKSEREAMQDGLMKNTPDTLSGLVEQVNLLARLVQDLRLLTTAEAGELELGLQPAALGEVVMRTVEAFQSMAANKGIELHCTARDVHARIDADRFWQVLMNLLENAVQYTPAGGRVQASLTAEKGWALVRMVDTGPGFSTAVLPRFFDCFYRADSSRSRQTGGLGLGLAIAKTLTELHGGTVRASNPPEGGACLELRLPLMAVA